MNKRIKIFLGILAAAIIFIVFMLEGASRGAADIFNKAMQEQNVLKGTITAEKIQATPTGNVTFINLVWKDERGGTILEIPEGSFKVKIFDVLTGNFKSTTIEELTLSNAAVSLNFDENMNVDFIRHSPDFKNVSQDMKKNTDSWEEKVSRENKTEEELKEIGERRRRLQQSKMEKDWKNFNLAGDKLNLNLKLNNCRFEVFYRERHYLLSGVQFETKINTDDEMTLNITTGTFGGMMTGRGMRINGRIDFKNETVPQCNMLIQLQEVDPSSLGFGMNIHDEMTLSARFTGPMSRPIGKGKVTMKELNLPGISFENVEGKIIYEDAMLNFKDVTADVYGGKLDAYGDYNIDTRYYNIYGLGQGLKAYTALPDSHLHCNVDLNLTIQSKGNAKETITFGDFVSGKGRYSILTFDSLQAKFHNEYDKLSFYDVIIKFTSGYQVSTDAFSIEGKKLKFNPLSIADKDGNIVRIFDPNIFMKH